MSAWTVCCTWVSNCTDVCARGSSGVLSSSSRSSIKSTGSARLVGSTVVSYMAVVASVVGSSVVLSNHSKGKNMQLKNTVNHECADVKVYRILVTGMLDA